MKVKELLTSLAPALACHQFASSGKFDSTLVIDIEHHCDFHAVGRFSPRSLEHHPDTTIMKPFETSYYKYYGREARSILSYDVHYWEITQTTTQDLKYTTYLFIHTRDSDD